MSPTKPVLSTRPVQEGRGREGKGRVSVNLTCSPYGSPSGLGGLPPLVLSRGRGILGSRFSVLFCLPPLRKGAPSPPLPASTTGCFYLPLPSGPCDETQGEHTLWGSIQCCVNIRFTVATSASGWYTEGLNLPSSMDHWIALSTLMVTFL